MKKEGASVIGHIAERILSSLAVLLLVSFITFTAMEIIPGNAAIVSLGTEGAQAQLTALESEMGLSQSFGARLFDYYRKLFSFDMGVSSYYGERVSVLILQRFPVTFALSFFSVLIALIVAIALGSAAAVKKGKLLDIFSRSIVQLASAMPSFWLSLLLLLLFSSVLHILPMGGYVSPSESLSGYISSIALPVLVLAVGELGPLIRLVRSSMLTAISEDWFQIAEIKGLSRMRVIFSYALRSALIAPITSAGIALSKLLGGTAVVESIFALPGIGRLFVTAVEMRDLELVQGIVITVTFLIVMMNLITDLVLFKVDPRMRKGGVE